MATVKPITPNDVVFAKRTTIPHQVISAFNELIIKHWNGDQAEIPQKEVLDRSLEMLNARKLRKITAEQLFRNHWFDIEEVFSEYGWKVTYDKPGYGEPDPASFIFRRKKNFIPQPSSSRG